MLRVAFAALWLGALTLAERRWPLRRPTSPPNRRFVINAVVGAVAFGALATVYGSTIPAAVEWAAGHELGLLRWLDVPAWLAAPLSIALLDYTLWHWHWLNHHVPLLWRFHSSHHADVDLDASTAIRFHPGELLLSVPFRVAQIVVLGVGLAPLLLWEMMVVVGVQFHHSNLRLPAAVDRALGWLVITPRIHGIHHSNRPRELHSNFGTLFSFWDRLHRLRIEDVAQESIVIGLPDRPEERALGIAASLRLPFESQRT